MLEVVNYYVLLVGFVFVYEVLCRKLQVANHVDRGEPCWQWRTTTFELHGPPCRQSVSCVFLICEVPYCMLEMVIQRVLTIGVELACFLVEVANLHC